MSNTLSQLFGFRFLFDPFCLQYVKWWYSSLLFLICTFDLIVNDNRSYIICTSWPRLLLAMAAGVAATKYYVTALNTHFMTPPTVRCIIILPSCHHQIDIFNMYSKHTVSYNKYTICAYITPHMKYSTTNTLEDVILISHYCHFSQQLNKQIK